MSRLAEKLQSSLFFTCTATRFISRLILSTFRLCNSLFTKTLTLTALLSPPSARLMDHDDNSNINNSSSNLFSNDDDDHLLDFDFNPSSSLQNYFYSFSPSGFIIYPAFREEDDRLKLYLVPYRWWKEAQQQIVADQKGGGGVVYRVSSNCDTDNFQIVLELKKLESFQESGNGNKDGSLGCEYALLPEGMWLRALKWHNDIKLASGNVGSPFIAGSYLQDVFPLQIRLSVLLETNSLVVKINLKDNKVNLYKRAYNIFISVSEQLFIWDFSGHTTQFFTNDRVNLSNDFTGQSEEILLELQVHGFSASLKESTDDMIEHPNTSDSFCRGSFKMNGIFDNLSPYTIPSTSICGSGGFSFLGLTGLQNLGNTCFMNSAIQCLAHTPELVDYFLGDYQKEINYDNPLGLKGELALAFGDLVRKIWSPGAMPIAPRMFKLKLVNFAPQFSGYNQHDSQEFLAFLLDGLHEDLNRVKCKPYIEAKDTEGRLEKEVAEEYWRNHRARNDSIIVDLCQGQYRSMLVCPNCKKVSVTFDPLMYLSLPLPSTTMRTMTVTVFSSDGSKLPIPLTVTVPKYGRTKDLIEALNISCSLRDEETLVVAEIYKNQIFRFLEEPSDSLALIRDEDKLVAYRLPKDDEASSLIVFVHRRRESESTSHLVQFGTPLVARLTDLTGGSEICNMFLKLLDPFLMPVDDVLIDLDDTGNIDDEDTVAEDSYSPTILDNDAGSDTEIGDEILLSPDFQFYYMGGQEETQIKMNEPISISEFNKPLNIIVNWSDKMSEKYDTHPLSSLLDVFKPQLWTRKPQESVSLYKCLEAFLKEEPLGPEDMWYCPRCQKHRQASKKLDLWGLPGILVIHLKRFSYSRYLKSKLETYVDFPIDDLDLSTYISHKDSQLSHRYVLYAISNHYGGMGGGHYTAFVDLGHKRWFEFDDDKVYPVSEEQIKTSAAYVLFYRRILDV